MGTFQDSKSTLCDVNILKEELLFALETARGRLAIAIAEESRSTPWDLRRHYLDTADNMRRFIARLRNGGYKIERISVHKWMSALEALRKISLEDGAQGLCGRLRGIVTALE